MKSFFTKDVELPLEMFCGYRHRVDTSRAKTMIDKDRDRDLRIAQLWSCKPQKKRSPDPIAAKQVSRTDMANGCILRNNRLSFAMSRTMRPFILPDLIWPNTSFGSLNLLTTPVFIVGPWRFTPAATRLGSNPNSQLLVLAIQPENFAKTGVSLILVVYVVISAPE